MATLISTPQELYDVRNDLSGTYQLTNDIDLSSWGNWESILNFTGQFDGNGFVIKNLTTTKSSGTQLGLFGQIIGATLENIGLENVNINAPNVRFVGSLAGNCITSTIKNCYVDGGSITAQEESGGLIGKADKCDIRNSYANISVTITTTYYGGGFVGTMDGSTVENSYSAGRVTYTQFSSQWRRYSGFVGLVWDTAPFTNTYWDKNTSTQSNVARSGFPPSTTVSGITGLTTSQMKQQSSYSGWDFNDVWMIDGDYPTLMIFAKEAEPEPPLIEEREITSFTGEIHSQLDIDTYLQPQSKDITVKSHISSISAHTGRFLDALREVESHSSRIHSNVTTSVISPNNDMRNVSSYINTLNTHVVTEIYRQPVKVTRSVSSYIQNLHTHAHIQTLVQSVPIIATASIHKNPSTTAIISNKSYLTYIENPSYVEVIN